MGSDGTTAFTVRLRDLLATLESTALIGAAETRMRGLAELLQLACLALPCDESFAALELGRLGRLQVPGIASAAEWRPAELELLPSGTPFAYLLGGGSGYAGELSPTDPLFEIVGGYLGTSPSHAIYIPVRVGGSVLGGVALLSESPLGDAQLDMAERIGEVLALTMESFRTSRVLLELFASALPDLCARDAATNFAAGLDRYVHELRLSPEYRRRLELAEMAGRIAAKGPAETRMVAGILARVDEYIRELGTLGDDPTDAVAGDLGLDPIEPLD